LEDVVQVAASVGLHLAESIEMPANNLCLVFRRAAAVTAAASNKTD
jgi:Protein of unknown function (DUF938)